MNRELIEQEIAGSKAALMQHQNGIEIHKIVVKAFEAELAKLPPKKDAKDPKK